LEAQRYALVLDSEFKLQKAYALRACLVIGPIYALQCGTGNNSRPFANSTKSHAAIACAALDFKTTSFSDGLKKGRWGLAAIVPGDI
jgi:hypothetical protein